MPTDDLDRFLSRTKEFLKLYIFLSLGGLLLISTFLLEKPEIRGAKPALLLAISCFFIAFLCFIVVAERIFDPGVRPGEKDKLEWRFKLIAAILWLGVRFFVFGAMVMFIFAVQVISSWP